MDGSTGDAVAGWGAVVRRLREERGWTQGQLGYHARVDQSQVSKIESGTHKDTRLSTVTRLARALGVGVDVLLGSASSPPPLGRAVLQQLEATVAHVVRAELDRALGAQRAARAPRLPEATLRRPRRRRSDQQPDKLGVERLATDRSDYRYLGTPWTGEMGHLVRAAAPVP